LEKEFWAYNTASLSSYSETLQQVQFGNNFKHDRLPQLNVTLVFGQESKLLFYYRKLAGNIPDTKTVRHLLEELDVLGYSKVKLVMDRGFYSEYNINCFYKDHLKFFYLSGCL
jgi:transposase